MTLLIILATFAGAGVGFAIMDIRRIRRKNPDLWTVLNSPAIIGYMVITNFLFWWVFVLYTTLMMGLSILVTHRQKRGDV